MLLTEGLVASGVDVTLFATADVVTAARLVGVVPTGYSEAPTLDVKMWEALHLAAPFERTAEFDLIHNRLDFLPLASTRLIDTSVVITMHGAANGASVPTRESRVPVTAVASETVSEARPHADGGACR